MVNLHRKDLRAGPRAYLLIVLVLLFLPLPRAYAASISVSGACTLDEAIDNANDNAQTHSDCTAGSGTDTITLSGNVTLSASLPDITTSMTITGGSVSRTIASSTTNSDAQLQPGRYHRRHCQPHQS